MENENLQVKEDDGLSLKDIFTIIKRHVIAICVFIVCFTAFGLGLGIYKDKKSPAYVAHSTMLINISDDTTSSGNMAATTKYQLAYYLKTTFVDFISTDIVVEDVVDRLQGQYEITAKEIRNSLSTKTSDDSLIVSLSYTSVSPEKSSIILNQIMESTREKTTTKDNDGKALYPLLNNNISIVDRASDKKCTISTQKKKMTIVFFAIGFVISCIYVALRELFDNSFKTSDQVEKELGIRVLSSVPLYEIGDNGKGEKK